MKNKLAIIGGAGTQSQFTSALIHQLVANDFHVIGIARNALGKEALLAAFENEEKVHFCWGDLNDEAFLERLVSQAEDRGLILEVYIHHAATLVLKSFLEATIADFDNSWQAGVRSAVVAAKSMVAVMLKRKRGTLIFAGATASLCGNATSSPFATAKFALRGFAQSLAREFGPRGIHVAHVVIDGVIKGQRAQERFGLPEDQCICPKALSRLYLNLMTQDPSCWTQEIDVRPAQEPF